MHYVKQITLYCNLCWKSVSMHNFQLMIYCQSPAKTKSISVKQIPFRMSMENAELMHECSPLH